ncbi:TPA: type II toxin-antitoxin system ParD family antitoxin [Yersinia enterocolitica]|nr:type II toxin-antitoxin system ParD family antitoxin [Yersinia intermedia]OWF85307.1 hypothetical protein B4916_23315 [Yersinia intermedia]
MPTSIPLMPYFEAFIRGQIQSGRYNNTRDCPVTVFCTI